jgi:hypothetical protein
MSEKSEFNPQPKFDPNPLNSTASGSRTNRTENNEPKSNGSEYADPSLLPNETINPNSEMPASVTPYPNRYEDPDLSKEEREIDFLTTLVGSIMQLRTFIGESKLSEHERTTLDQLVGEARNKYGIDPMTGIQITQEVTHGSKASYDSHPAHQVNPVESFYPTSFGSMEISHSAPPPSMISGSKEPSSEDHFEDTSEGMGKVISDASHSNPNEGSRVPAGPKPKQTTTSSIDKSSSFVNEDPPTPNPKRRLATIMDDDDDDYDEDIVVRKDRHGGLFPENDDYGRLSPYMSSDENPDTNGNKISGTDLDGDEINPEIRDLIISRHKGERDNQMIILSESEDEEPIEEGMDMESYVNKLKEDAETRSKEMENQGIIYKDEAEFAFQFQRGFNAPPNEAVQAFFQSLSPKWYQRARFRLRGSLLYVRIIDDRLINEAYMWLERIKQHVAAFAAANCKLCVIAREHDTYSVFGLPAGKDINTYKQILFQHTKIPRNGLEKVIIFVNEWDESTGLIHLVYSAPPPQFYRVGMGETKEERRLELRFPGNHLFVNKFYGCPTYLCHKCSFCNKRHPAIRCSNDGTGKARKLAPQVMIEDIIFEKRTQTRQWAFKDGDVIPRLDPETERKIQLIIDKGPGAAMHNIDEDGKSSNEPSHSTPPAVNKGLSRTPPGFNQYEWKDGQAWNSDGTPFKGTPISSINRSDWVRKPKEWLRDEPFIYTDDESEDAVKRLEATGRKEEAAKIRSNIIKMKEAKAPKSASKHQTQKKVTKKVSGANAIPVSNDPKITSKIITSSNKDDDPPSSASKQPKASKSKIRKMIDIDSPSILIKAPITPNTSRSSKSSASGSTSAKRNSSTSSPSTATPKATPIPTKFKSTTLTSPLTPSPSIKRINKPSPNPTNSLPKLSKSTNKSVKIQEEDDSSVFKGVRDLIIDKIDKDLNDIRTPKHLKGTRGNKEIKPIYENLNELPDLKRKRKRSNRARSEKLFEEALNEISSPSKKPRHNYGEDNYEIEPFEIVAQSDTLHQTITSHESPTLHNNPTGRIKSPKEGLHFTDNEQ